MKIHSGEVLPGSDWVSTKASIYLSPWGRSFREEDQKHVRGIAKFQKAAADLTAWSWKQGESREGGTKMEQEEPGGKDTEMLGRPGSSRRKGRPLGQPAGPQLWPLGHRQPPHAHLRLRGALSPVILMSHSPPAAEPPLAGCSPSVPAGGHGCPPSV